MVDETYNEILSTDDPLYSAKYTSIQSLNQLSGNIRENRNSIYSKIFYVFSLVIGIFTAIFAEQLNWLIVLFLTDLSMIFLVFFCIEYYKKRKEFRKQREIIITHLGKLGIKIKK